jgi:hypothetical protein
MSTTLKPTNDKERKIIELASKYLLEEIEYFYDLYAVENEHKDYSVEDAFNDAVQMYEDCPKLRKCLMTIHIAIGNYKPITRDQYESIVSTGDKRRSNPKFKGQYYEWV